MPKHRSIAGLLVIVFGVLSSPMPASVLAAASASRFEPDVVSSPVYGNGSAPTPRWLVAQGGGASYIDLYEGIDEVLHRREETGGIEPADAMAALERLVADGIAAERDAREALTACDRGRYDAYREVLGSLLESEYPEVARAIEDELLFAKWLASFSPESLAEGETMPEVRRWELIRNYLLYVRRDIAHRIATLPPFLPDCVVVLPKPEVPAGPSEEASPGPPPGEAPAEPKPPEAPAEQALFDPRIDTLSGEASAAADSLRTAAESCDAELYEEAARRFEAALAQLWSLHDQWSALALRGSEVDPRYLRDWQRAALTLATLERLRRSLPNLATACGPDAAQQAFRITRFVQFIFPYAYPGDITCWEEGTFRTEMTVATGTGDELAGDGRYTLDARVNCKAPSPIVDRGTVKSESTFAVRGTLTGDHLLIEGPQHPATKWTMGWPRDGGWYETTSESASTVPDAWRTFDAELENGSYLPFGYSASLTLPFFPPAPGEVTLQTRTVTTIRPLGATELGGRGAAGSGE